MKILSYYEEHIKQKLSPAQVETLKILLWLITVHKEVRIERLAAYFPLPNNILLISVVWKKRALPLYWQLLDGNGASSLKEQQSVIRPIFKLLKTYQVIVIGDREFHSVELAYWLKSYEKQGVKFALRQKKTTNVKRGRIYRPLKELEVIPGVKHFLVNQKITKEKGFGTYNLLLYKKKGKKVEEAWYILTNLSVADQVVKIYQKRMGIEAMFKDYKTGGYDLEGSKANTQRLTNLVLLISIAYTLSSFKGQKIKNKGYQKYLSRLTEKGRSVRRHSSFWLGLYGVSWTVSYNFLEDLVVSLMKINSQKLPFYQRGIRAMIAIESVFNS